MPEDLQTLTWLRSQLVEIASGSTTAKAAINKEAKIAVLEIRKDKIDTILQALDDEYVARLIPKDSAKTIREAADVFFSASRAYYTNYMTGAQAALDLPYPQAYKRLDELNEKTKTDAAENPAAILTAALAPAIAKVCGVETKSKTFFNVIMAAVDIYTAKAKTGRLPDSLDAGSSRDLFSGKDFEYEKTKDGFILRCRGRDLDKDEIHQYEFKVPK